MGNNNDETPKQSDKRGRGFASMDRQRQREIASKGGKSAHAKGTAHEFNCNEAREAGRRGGIAVSQNRPHMAEIGGKGGHARGRKQAEARAARLASGGPEQSSPDAAAVPQVETEPPGATHEIGSPGAPTAGRENLSPSKAHETDDTPELIQSKDAEADPDDPEYPAPVGITGQDLTGRDFKGNSMRGVPIAAGPLKRGEENDDTEDESELKSLQINPTKNGH